MMEQFTAKPTASIPEAGDNGSETCAAWRFLGNDEASWQDIPAPQWERTGAATQERLGHLHNKVPKP
ncbi:transposase DNA-binding-containing protein [Janthinobacterium sp. RB2R34]|uniref:transposase DNA-binding-containing protein n=1 Tax=Janthinobacterium sp. RB2R34 TaxID=3424193 RepID=UPI003F27356B